MPVCGDESITQDGQRQGMLPTYERLFSQAVVLDRAISLLEDLPAEARIDLAPYPRDKWLDEMRDRLRANVVRATNFIEISFPVWQTAHSRNRSECDRGFLHGLYRR